MGDGFGGTEVFVAVAGPGDPEVCDVAVEAAVGVAGMLGSVAEGCRVGCVLGARAGADVGAARSG